MQFTYQGKTYEMASPSTWTTLEAIKLERYAELRAEVVMRALAGLHAVGIHGAIWISLRRAGLDIAWDDLDMNFVDTMESLQGEPVEEPPDPSTASTEAPKAVKRTRSASARSPKK